MKLITLLILVTTCCANEHGLQQFSQQQFQFPLQFQTSQQAPFVKENNLYLPPDTQTTEPYFPPKNDLQYPYLPPTDTKVPSKYPPPFHMVSTFRTNYEEEDEEYEEDDKQPFVSSTGAPDNQIFNQTRNSPGPQIEIPNRPIPKSLPYYNPNERIDTKFIHQANFNVPTTSTQSPFNFPSQNRRMIQQPIGFVGNPNLNNQKGDQIASGSNSGHYLAPQVYGPTPEPVPILRLSNEMDLDGSYSYEALSADQTHMMQHGHVENAGTDHAENVVEGSYSYVGDNGQTYTVHYIADGNGFRASGDHLPVAPPIPEIIQRSIEYNIAEESSPKAQVYHGQDHYHDESRVNQVRAYNYHQQQSQQPRATVTAASLQPMPSPPPSPPRNLFTGRKPEAFSYNNNAATNSQNHNTQPAASTQSSVIAHYEASTDPPAPTVTMHEAPISPQITFLASQGAHNPSEPSPSSISRMFAPVNYENPVFRFGNLRNGIERKSSWQYQHPLPEFVTRQPQHKNFISRSSIDSEDDVMINFSEMNPEQYSRIYHSQINPSDDIYDVYEGNQNINPTKSKNILDREQNLSYSQPSHEGNYKLAKGIPMNFYHNQIIPNPYDNQNAQTVHLPHQQYRYSNPNVDQNQPRNDMHSSDFESRSVDMSEQRQNLVTKDYFIPRSHIISSAYDVRKDIHEARTILDPSNETAHPQFEQNTSTLPSYEMESNEDTLNASYYEIYKSNISSKTAMEQTTEAEKYQTTPSTTTTTTTQSHIQQIQPIPDTHFDRTTPNQEIKSKENWALSEPDQSKLNYETSSKEDNFDNILESNIFLKNMFNNNKETLKIDSNKNDNWRPSSIQSQPKKIDEKKVKKEIKMYHPKTTTINDVTDTQRKAIDVSQLANLVTLKNYFESNKINPTKQANSHKVRTGHDDFSKKHNQESNKVFKDKKNIFNDNTYKGHNQNLDRIMGVAKIYKTLQRNSKLESSANGQAQLRTDLVPPAQDFSILHKTQQSLPPLGRAGPSMKSYLPPLFS